jgi:hypothetical protein
MTASDGKTLDALPLVSGVRVDRDEETVYEIYGVSLSYSKACTPALFNAAGMPGNDSTSIYASLHT